MKKIYIAAISLLALLLVSSCSNDDINIEKVGRKYNLTLNVSTQGLYDQFNITSSVRENFLRDGSRQIGVFAFVYDAKGDLIQREQKYLNNYNTANIQFGDLVEGEYTIITIETLVNPDDNYSIETFTLDDSEKLSTFKISEKTVYDDKGEEWAKIAWAPEVIGVNTKEVNLTGNNSLDIKPEAIGAVIEFAQYNWDKSDYVTIGWSTMDVLSYYSIDPSLSREARYNKNLTVSGKTNARALFDVNEEPLNYFGIYVLEKDIDWRIAYQDSKAIEEGGVYESDPVNQTITDGQLYFIGTYLGADKYFRYELFENQTDLYNWKTKLDNTVGPYSGTTSTNLYTTPYTNWSVGTVSAVKSHMSSFTLVEDITLQDNGKYEMTYMDTHNYNTIYMYDFNTSTNGLTDAYVGLSKDYFKIDQVKTELTSTGFTVITEGDTYTVYANSARTTAVYLNEGTSYIIVNYYDPAAYTSSASRRAISERRMKDIPVLNVTGSQKLLIPFKTSSMTTMKANPNAIMKISK